MLLEQGELSDYRVLELIGEGSFGKVYKVVWAQAVRVHSNDCVPGTTKVHWPYRRDEIYNKKEQK